MIDFLAPGLQVTSRSASFSQWAGPGRVEVWLATYLWFLDSGHFTMLPFVFLLSVLRLVLQ